jgi:hypothetical protein
VFVVFQINAIIEFLVENADASRYSKFKLKANDQLCCLRRGLSHMTSVIALAEGVLELIEPMTTARSQSFSAPAAVLPRYS